MIDPRIALVILGLSAVIWLGGESVKGVRWAKHHAQSAVHHVLHPHEVSKK